MKIIANNKLLLKILSALIAVILWIAITYSEDPIISQTLSGISVDFAGEEVLHNKGLIVTNKDSIPAISAVVRGNRSKVISSIGSISAVIDVSEINEAGSNSVSVEYSYPTSAVTLVKGKVSEVNINTEKIVTRSIPVQIETINQDKNENYIVKSDSRISTLRIKGAESEIYKISYAKALVDVSNVSKTSSQEYVYKFYDEKDNTVPDTNIMYRSHNTVNVDNTVYKKTTLPVEAVLSDAYSEDYGLVVKSLSKTSVEVGLEDGISTDSVRAVITNILSENGKYELTLQADNGVYIPEKSKQITVVCEVVPKVIKEIEVPVTVENMPEGKTYSLTEDKLKVSVKGIEKEITADKIKAVIDASELPSGKGTAAVDVTADGGITVVGAYSAEIEIR